MSFSVTGANVCVYYFYFVYHFVGEGARGWVVGTAGYMGAPDFHLRQMLIMSSIVLWCWKGVVQIYD